MCKIKVTQVQVKVTLLMTLKVITYLYHKIYIFDIDIMPLIGTDF